MTQYYSSEFKLSLVGKALREPERSKTTIAKEANVSSVSLYKWIKNHQNGIMENTPSRPKRPQDWTPEERLAAVLESANLSEDELGAYCRNKGLFSHQLEAWKKELMSNERSKSHEKQRAELKALRAENKYLKQDLRRKEKALAETSAILVLKKKADLIWGVGEDD